MPRPLRIEFPGACYHIMFRGNARLPVFRDDADKELLVDRMVHFASLFRIRIRAYCIMLNHAHIHVRTDEANLGRYMQSFLTSYTACHNHRHGSCGHVFQGRYKAFLVEDRKVWRSQCTRYIHLNPARIPALDDAPVEARIAAVRQCRKLASWCPLERVVAAVAAQYGCEQSELLRRYNRGCEARQVLLYLAAAHCRGRYSLSELGLRLGPVAVSTIAAAGKRVAACAADDSGLWQRIDAIEQTL